MFGLEALIFGFYEASLSLFLSRSISVVFLLATDVLLSVSLHRRGSHCMCVASRREQHARAKFKL